MRKGLTHIYTGDGKGKTTCAVGLCLRAAGNGLTVKFFQFCKGRPSGELKPLGSFCEVRRADAEETGFTWEMTEEQKAAWTLKQHDLFDEACEAACSKDNDLVVLDEALGAMNAGALSEDQLCYLIGHKNPGTELVITGRGATKRLMELSDYVTEMRPVKHPMEAGIYARKGIEY